MAFPSWTGQTFSADRVKSIDGCVNVQWFGAKGSGLVGDTAANDAAFSAARAFADLTNRGLYFPTGHYYFSSNLPLKIPLSRIGMELCGDSGQTTLHYTGAGEIVFFDGGGAATVGAGLYGCFLHDLILVGTATATIGVRGRNFHQSRIWNVQIQDVTTAALYLETCSQNEVDGLACTVNRIFFAITPTYGIYLTQRGGGVDPPGFTCTMNEFRNCPLEGLSTGTGIYLDNAVDNAFLDCAPEGNVGGVFLSSNAIGNYFLRTEFVQNASFDIDCAGLLNIFEAIQSQNGVTWQIGARGNVLSGGLFAGAVVNLSAFPQYLSYPAFTIAGTAAFNDPLSSGVYWSNVDNIWHHRLPGLATFADNATATAGGLVAGDVYRTATGTVMVVF